MASKFFKFNAGTGMVYGIVLATILALVVQHFTKDSSIWIWILPIGVAVGFAIGVSVSTLNLKETNQLRKKK